MSRAAATIRSVAPKNKGHEKTRALRLKADLNDDVVLLAEVHHRSANDEIIVALERHLEAHAAELKDFKRRSGR
ncbi:MAG TPA: hypothetical protein VLC46_16375 [Thermoanaerobaculia bacterium]|jgi:hypothetical protein|nr:hypothetical protein [Thermoanaerobaculia bacterium]